MQGFRGVGLLTQKTQNPEGQREGTSKDLYRPYLRPKPRGVSMLFFLEPNVSTCHALLRLEVGKC